MVVGPLESNCWIVGDDHAVAVIDPGDDPELIVEAIGDSSVAAVILTHCHFDHLGAASRIVEITGAPLMAHSADAAFVSDPVGTGGVMFGLDAQTAPVPDRRLDEGDSISIGSLSIQIIHTPGHTPGGMCLFVTDPQGGPPQLFSGDTLFAGSVGRTDFPRGDSAALRKSIAEKLSALALETVVHPGHGPDTTILRESRINPFWPRA